MDFQYLVLFFLSIFSILSFLYWRRGDHHEPQLRLKQYPLVGTLPEYLKNRHHLLDWLTEALAASPTNTIILDRPGLRDVYTANPANVEHVLRTQFDRYPKGALFVSTLHDFLGTGIFNSDGDAWKLQRKTAALEFSTRSLRSFVAESVREETGRRLLPLLERAATAGEAVDLQDVLERYAFDNVCKVSFGVDPACLAVDGNNVAANNEKLSSSFADAFRDATNISSARFRYAVPSFWRVKKLLGIGSESRLKESVSIVHDFATQIIRSRVKERKLGHAEDADLLSRFVANEGFSEEFLRDIVISFVLAGRETTSSALTWFFWLLDSHPDVERRVLAEIRAARRAKGSDGTFDFDELKGMQYLHAAITEAMRLYPPVPLNTVECGADDVLPDGTRVREGWFVWYNAYAMGRMEGIWGKDCREFRPERWIDDRGAFVPQSQFKFVAFHAGPRLCLGKEMAYVQMKSIAAAVLERFAVEVVDRSKAPEQMLSLTLRMKGGLPVRVSARRVADRE